ncbi:ribonuclease H-like protein [Exidia glandulosa HHB12029]|uniref:ribonuclease H n=1 Tax=Exidia glandulosa HHB12029 TaxID=1314781 RepID=A0A165R3A3_EXIGL|nr:ribonuclease H-like protein [Exidia glandulosa HHB12029]
MTDRFLSSLYQPRTGQGIRGHRRWYFCESVVKAHFPQELIRTCGNCGHFFTRCCPGEEQLREKGYDPESSERLCHNYCVVYTDGACLNNGRRDSPQFCGLGIAMGTGDDDQLSVPVNEEVDSGATRTNQRAELLAAIAGLNVWMHAFVNGGFPDKNTHTKDRRAVIIATDSEYVVKGITEWYPTWKARDWRAADGKTPKNLDLFHKLNDAAVYLESNVGVDVGFLHLLREVRSPIAIHPPSANVQQYNVIADGLAKEGAEGARAASMSRKLTKNSEPHYKFAQPKNRLANDPNDHKVMYKSRSSAESDDFEPRHFDLCLVQKDGSPR